jgi:predicted NBD/HSP70 family sugar kinase
VPASRSQGPRASSSNVHTEDRSMLRQIGDQNLSKVFAKILTNDEGGISRSQLARETGLSQATVTKAVKDLLGRDLLVEFDQEKVTRGGRPAIPLRVKKNRIHAIGIWIMGVSGADSGPYSKGKLVGVVTNLAAEIVERVEHPLEPQSLKEPDVLINKIVDLINQLGGKRRREIIGVGAALGGHIHRVNGEGEVRTAANLGWDNIPLGRLLRERTSFPRIVVENDVNALAIYEQWFGQGRDIDWFTVIWVGAGIGCGLVLNGELVHGGTGGAGELGHVVVEPKGEVCERCGGYGCLRTVASIAAILKAIRVQRSDISDVRGIIGAAKNRDKVVEEALERAGEALGRALSMVINIVNPIRVILSGPGVVPSERPGRDPVLFSDQFMDVMDATLRRHTFSNLYHDCKVLTRTYTDDQGAQGAASTVLRDFIAYPLGT